ncbi:hypothetical protein [Paraclostridium bifermentans]|uniref:hypothetical protein n=1 Tax=Paraclostridium bifermentans TaxID=1490 RepID=UPI00189A5E33|nr:hypothetical protein [Paraclostridium bifermentans]
MVSSTFNTNEIITIVMAMIEDIKNESIYGIESDELNIPNDISEKIDNLGDIECEKFFSLLDEISNRVYNLKNGELHELNIIHKEIIEFSSVYLNEYMV